MWVDSGVNRSTPAPTVFELCAVKVRIFTDFHYFQIFREIRSQSILSDPRVPGMAWFLERTCRASEKRVSATSVWLYLRPSPSFPCLHHFNQFVKIALKSLEVTVPAEPPVCIFPCSFGCTQGRF